MNSADTDHSSDRLVGALTIGTAIASLALLGAHPNEQARGFAEVVQEEARNQQQNLIVHGGYIVVLSVQLVCFGFLSSCVSHARLAPRAAMTFFAIGAAWTCAALFFDGLVTPLIAMRYVEQPYAASPLFALIRSIVRCAMPIGFGFQALAVLCWSVAMLASRLRVSSGLACVLGVAFTLAAAAVATSGMPMAFTAAFVAIGLWAAIAGFVLLRSSAAA